MRASLPARLLEAAVMSLEPRARNYITLLSVPIGLAQPPFSRLTLL